MDYLQKIEEIAKDVFNVNYLRPAQEAVITKIVENAFLKQKSDSITEELRNDKDFLTKHGLTETDMRIMSDLILF